MLNFLRRPLITHHNKIVWAVNDMVVKEAGSHPADDTVWVPDLAARKHARCICLTLMIPEEVKNGGEGIVL